ncbi:hypothetical protein K458DRAFT_392093 [Lentithecium fluviatile CBS 122367]|uniref:Uncharacterized protein n=1 Tax=Lentithecium fluviatile CBS 122367 TaxID=1168545 RepID=A0A6G1IST0_9PLEO|nr:hypothetical protein K458DRAFT_392093 [Lentithecium fluviatile CBS 122367]
MLRTATATIAKRIPRTLARPIPCASVAQFNASCAHVPAQAQLDDTSTTTHEALDSLSIMTYSPWDPCVTRPLQILHSGLVMPAGHAALRIEDILAHYASPTPAPTPAPQPQKSKQLKTTAVVKVSEKKAMVVVRQPWPYRLPRFLRPKAGTTFYAMYGPTSTTSTTRTTIMAGAGGECGGNVEKEVRVGLFQALLYGVPDPNAREVKSEKSTIFKKVLYGVPETDEFGKFVQKKVVETESVEVEEKTQQITKRKVEVVEKIKWQDLKIMGMKNWGPPTDKVDGVEKTKWQDLEPKGVWRLETPRENGFDVIAK